MTHLPIRIGKRRAISIVEMVAGMAIMTVTIVLVAQVYVLVQRAARVVERRQVATVAAANVLERVAGTPWNQLDQSLVTDWELAPDAQSLLPNGALTIRIKESQDGLASKRIEVGVSWSEALGTQPGCVCLVMWRYDTKETRP